MMASNLFSRFASDGPSGYDRLRDDQDPDVEAAVAHAIDEENFAHQFHDDDLEHADHLALDDSRISAQSPVTLHRDPSRRAARQGKQPASAKWPSHDDDGDNDVPASLLVEGPPAVRQTNPRRTGPRSSKPPAASGPANPRVQAQWEATQAQQRLHDEDEQDHLLPGQHPLKVSTRRPGLVSNPRDKAMYRWANVSNVDIFIKDVYDYYNGAGIRAIQLHRVLHLVKLLVMMVILTSSTQCIDFGRIRHSKSLSEIWVDQCFRKMWWGWNAMIWFASFYLIWKTIQWTLDNRRLTEVRDFYIHLLEIPDEDMQTVSWQDVVSKITGLRDQNVKTATNITPSQRKFLSQQLGQQVVSQSKERLDAHDIANRLMRRENYVIALFNKDVLNLTAPIPFLSRSNFFCKTLEWAVQFAVLDLIFNESGQVHQRVLKSEHRGKLGQELRTRFGFAALMSLFCTPFIAGFLVVDFVFTYYNEFKEHSTSIGSRQYTPLARWKFREFNELPHLFEERLNMSYPFAKHYIDQFPKLKTEMLARTVQFVTGALMAVIAIVGFSDPEMFVDFEIFPGMQVFAFVTILAAVWTVARGQLSEENDVFDPEFAMRNVIQYTHYEPDQWRGRLHSYDVKAEFSELYKVRIINFLSELLGVLVTPLVLYWSLPQCSNQIIDFFREFTIHVDGLGYVCSFAVFDFQRDQRNTKQQPGVSSDAREDYYSTKHNKMQASMFGFLDNYVYNPKSGLPGSHALGMPSGRHQFYPPPHFPGLMSPTLAADMRTSRIGRSERPQSRAPPGSQHPGRTPRVGPMVAPSPMASMLLDPHHQPSASLIAGRTPQHRGRQPLGHMGGEGDIIEESRETSRVRGFPQRQTSNFTDDGAGVEESVARLGESTWEPSPQQPLTRESSAVTDTDDQPGVVTLLKQFQQAHMNQRAVM